MANKLCGENSEWLISKFNATTNFGILIMYMSTQFGIVPQISSRVIVSTLDRHTVTQTSTALPIMDVYLEYRICYRQSTQ